LSYFGHVYKLCYAAYSQYDNDHIVFLKKFICTPLYMTTYIYFPLYPQQTFEIRM